MNKCTECGSYAINHHCHGRDGSDPELCDVCYWRKRAADYTALEAERDTMRQQRDKLAQVLEGVEREHDLLRQMKNCELHRGRGSFGIAVMSDAHAIGWQALDKELQQLIDARRAALPFAD